ncbi:NAP1-related protein 2-like isoform X2 [Papaver somniferum]|uniref:NAP1-related protein 2-like isoform X2 n=1 Tax=Papaver somniferum TaxID=3469 RepID=UPI000E6F5227|nr:NAP1-related protein 2-like isoform X2 [Papaver somniferum]
MPLAFLERRRSKDIRVSKVYTCRRILKTVNLGTLFFNFAENQYFENESLTKKLLYSDRGVETCGCTIKWKDGFESLDGEGEKQGYINGETSFINWFSYRDDDIKGMTDEVAYMIIDDFWPNAVKYFINGNFTDEEELAI